jgi:hypothetical protein
MSSKIIAAIQSNYIPWKGYFDIINRADEFVLYDDVQYTKNDWRNRNKIKTNEGLIWLTIPINHKIGQKINEATVFSQNWRKKHWTTICQNYVRTRYFNDYKPVFEDLYLGNHEKYLSQINYQFICAINKILGITTKISWLTDYHVSEGKTDRLLDLIKQTGSNHYISGPSARSYLNEEEFKAAGISIEWINYGYYQEYTQLFPPFEHRVSVLDLIFNTGPEALNYF